MDESIRKRNKGTSKELNMDLSSTTPKKEDSWVQVGLIS